MKRAIVYARFSPRPNAEECLSNEKQMERCREFCSRQSYEIAGECQDDSVSGGLLVRPGLTDAMSMLSLGMVLVVDRVDRLARDMLVSLTIRNEVDRAGCTIEFADGSPNADTPEGKLFGRMLDAFAEYERDRIRLRTKAGLAKKQANGEHLGRAPAGYCVDQKTKRLTEHPEEYRAIGVAKQLSEDGKTSLEIAEFLTDKFGLFRGNPWSDRTVRKILARTEEL